MMFWLPTILMDSKRISFFAGVLADDEIFSSTTQLSFTGKLLCKISCMLLSIFIDYQIL